jgi:hypothetical protein
MSSRDRTATELWDDTATGPTMTGKTGSTEVNLTQHEVCLLLVNGGRRTLPEATPVTLTGHTLTGRQPLSPQSAGRYPG